MKNLSQRIQKARAALQTLIEEMEIIDREMALMASGYSCELAEVKIIQEMVASHYGLTPQIMMSAVRTEEYSNARGLAMYLSKEITFHGLREISNCFGGRTTGMVIHAHERILERMSNNQAFANDVEELMKAAKSRIADDLKERKAKIAESAAIVVTLAVAS